MTPQNKFVASESILNKSRIMKLLQTALTSFYQFTSNSSDFHIYGIKVVLFLENDPLNTLTIISEESYKFYFSVAKEFTEASNK